MRIPERVRYKTMNKQMSKQYKEYVTDCQEKNETPISIEVFIKESELQEKQEKQDYLDYQKKIAEHNSVILEGKEPEKILNKDEWIKAGKPTEESKHERFIRLVEKRTEKALDAVDKLFALKGANYESSFEERMQVIHALTEVIKELENHYIGQKEISTGFKIQAPLVLETHLPDNQDLQK